MVDSHPEWAERKYLESVLSTRETYAAEVFRKANFEHLLFRGVRTFSPDKKVRQLSALQATREGAQVAILVLERGDRAFKNHPLTKAALEYIGDTAYGTTITGIEGGMRVMQPILDDLVRIDFVARQCAEVLLEKNPGVVSVDLEKKLRAPFRGLPENPDISELLKKTGNSDFGLDW